MVTMTNVEMVQTEMAKTLLNEGCMCCDGAVKQLNQPTRQQCNQLASKPAKQPIKQPQKAKNTIGQKK